MVPSIFDTWSDHSRIRMVTLTRAPSPLVSVMESLVQWRGMRTWNDAKCSRGLAEVVKVERETASWCVVVHRVVGMPGCVAHVSVRFHVCAESARHVPVRA
jgi:hypothetical protein